MKKREYPTSPLEDPEFANSPPSLGARVDGSRPMTPLQALMEARPGDDPEVSRMELLALRDLLADAFEQLTPLEQWVLNATVIERKSYRSVARDIGYTKSSIHRIRNTAFGKLREALGGHPMILDYLEAQ